MSRFLKRHLRRCVSIGLLAFVPATWSGDIAFAEEGLRGRVIPFSNVSIGAINDRRSAFDIELSVHPNSERFDWGATATEIARSVLKDANLDYVKVTVLRADEEHLSPARGNRRLAEVYYGPNPATSPWPNDPFALMLYPRALSEAEIRAEDEFNKQVESYSHKYGEEKGEQKLNDLVAKKFKLKKEWHFAVVARWGFTTFHDLALVGADADEQGRRQLREVADCVKKFREVGGALGRTFECSGGQAVIDTRTSPVLDPAIPLSIRAFLLRYTRMLALQERCGRWKIDREVVRSESAEAGLRAGELSEGGRYFQPFTEMLEAMIKGTATESKSEACATAQKSYPFDGQMVAP